MITKTSLAENFFELHESIQEIRNFHKKRMDSTIYRGHKSLDYELIPKVGRIDKFRYTKLKMGQDFDSSLVDQERYILQQFKDKALPLLSRTPADDWEWLAIGQHHGLSTRLLDWSKNPLVAAYFAVEEEYEGNSVIYSFNKGYFNYCGKNPFSDVIGIKRINPASYTRRIEAQSGVFTIHEDPKEPLENIAPKGKLHKIIIHRSFREELRELLTGYGINRAKIFPDLDGIAYFINSYFTKISV